MALSTKQRLFVEFYLGDAKGNAAQAARLAGYRDAKNEGYRLKRHPDVAAMIEERITEAAMSADEVMMRLAEHARASMEQFFKISKTGRVTLDFEKARKAGVLFLIKSYSNSPKNGVVIELHDSQAALVQLGKYHKLFTDKVDVAVDVEDALTLLRGALNGDTEGTRAS